MCPLFHPLPCIYCLLLAYPYQLVPRSYSYGVDILPLLMRMWYACTRSLPSACVVPQVDILLRRFRLTSTICFRRPKSGLLSFFSWVFQVHGTEESACHYKSYKSTHGNAQMHLVYRNFHIAPRDVKRVHLTWTISKVRKVRLSGSDGCLFKFMAQTRGQTITMIIMLSLEIPTTHTNALSDLCMCASPRNPNPCHAQLRLP